MKKMLRLSTVTLAVLLASCQQHSVNTTSAPLPAGVQLVKTHTATKAGEVAIPYKQYQLKNGLTVLIHEDHSDPMVHVDVTYHVGSAREEMGKSGFAHFFEHMMFQGSEHVADEQHIKTITSAGGRMNGTTNSDRTNYFETVPVNQLEKMLWLESDRMGFLLPAVTEKKFEVQRETVKNERGQRVDNQPYGRLNERVAAALYPDGHPYSWPVIGHMDDLNRANVNDVKAFFLRWYGPNNATLTIGGAVKAEEVLPLVEKYFGDIPQGPAVEPAAKTAVTLSENRYISMEDRVHLPLLYMVFPTVYARHEDEAALDVLSQILGSGNNSLLYKNLVKTQKAVQAQSSHGCMELACEFSLYALPTPGSVKSLAETEAQLRASLAEFEQRGVTDDDLTKIKAQIEANTLFGLQSVAGKVSQLAHNQTFFGNADLSNAELERYRKVTKEDVVRVYQKYLKGKASVVMSVVPLGQKQLIAAADNFKPVKHQYQQSTTTEADLALRVATKDFDRSKEPAAGANPAVALPVTWQQTLSNQVKVLGSQNLETPTTTLMLQIPLGRYRETADKAGLTSLLAAMLNESTKNRTTEQMSLELEKLGSQIDFSASDEYINVYVQSLSKHLPATLNLLNEKLLEPAFASEDFARLQQQTLQGIQQNEKDASALAQQAVDKLMYGSHIAGMSELGTLETVKALTTNDLIAAYQRFFKPAGSRLIIVSDLPAAELTPTLDKALASWQGQAEPLQVSFSPAAGLPGTIYLVDKPDAPQSEIRLVRRSMPKDVTGEYFRVGLANFAIGGNFNSRLNLKLREEKGYTYGARSGVQANLHGGVFEASAAVRANATVDALKDFISEMQRYANEGVTADELSFMRTAINQSEALNYETPGARLRFMSTILDFPQSGDFVSERNKIVASISAAEINALAKKYYNPADFSIVVVGSAKELQEPLKAIGLPVQLYKLN